MQLPIHILSGTLIQKSFFWKRYRFFSLFFCAVLAFFVHGLVDELGRICYQSEQAQWANLFWLSYQTINILLALVFFYLFGKDYWWGILISILPDLELWMMQILNLFNQEIYFYKTPWIHHFLQYVFQHTFPFHLLQFLPNWNLIPWAVFCEYALCAGLLFYIRWQQDKDHKRRFRK